MSRARCLLFGLHALLLLLLLLRASGCERNAGSTIAGGRFCDWDFLTEDRAPTETEIAEITSALFKTCGSPPDGRVSVVFLQDLYAPRTGMEHRSRKSVWIRDDDMLFVDLNTRGARDRYLLYDGDGYVSVQGGPLRAASGTTLDTLRWEYKIYLLPWTLRRPGVKVSGERPREAGGRRLAGLRVQDGQRPDLTVWIDPDGPVIRQVEALLPVIGESREGKLVAQARQEFEDFARKDGVLLPRTTRSYSDGELTALLDTLEVEWKPIPDDVFAPDS